MGCRGDRQGVGARVLGRCWELCTVAARSAFSAQGGHDAGYTGTAWSSAAWEGDRRAWGCYGGPPATPLPLRASGLWDAQLPETPPPRHSALCRVARPLGHPEAVGLRLSPRPAACLGPACCRGRARRGAAVMAAAHGGVLAPLGLPPDGALRPQGAGCVPPHAGTEGGRLPGVGGPQGPPAAGPTPAGSQLEGTPSRPSLSHQAAPPRF